MVAVARPASDERDWLMETERGSWQGRGVDLPLLFWKYRSGESDLGGVCVVERTKSCCWRWGAGRNVQGDLHRRQKHCAYQTSEIVQRRSAASWLSPRRRFVC